MDTVILVGSVVLALLAVALFSGRPGRDRSTGWSGDHPATRHLGDGGGSGGGFGGDGGGGCGSG